MDHFVFYTTDSSALQSLASGKAQQNSSHKKTFRPFLFRTNCVCVHVYIHACTCAYVYVCMCVCVCTMSVCVWVCACGRGRVRVHEWVCVYVCVGGFKSERSLSLTPTCLFFAAVAHWTSTFPGRGGLLGKKEGSWNSKSAKRLP